MKYFICDQTGIYLGTKLGQYTTDPKKAGRWIEVSASNILRSSLPTENGRTWRMIPETETVTPVEKPAEKPAPAPVKATDISAILSMNWDTFAQEQSEQLRVLLDGKATVQKRIGELESEQNDLLHAIELHDYSIAEQLELFAQLQKNRRSRRVYKDSLLLLDELEHATARDLADGRLARLVEKLRRRNYTPRVREDLFLAPETADSTEPAPTYTSESEEPEFPETVAF